MPKGELHVFDRDDFFEHSDFNYYNSIKDSWHSASDNFKFIWEDYHDKYKNKAQKLKGEEPIGYVPSKNAFKRISMQKKPIKIIVVLRKPTSKAYSNYHQFIKKRKGPLFF